ncbi:hypothetical protein PYV02_06925 [Leifsonia sp. H3M29-4]|uniref:hypothetical protein n=1 Tax=Salinibacterium metalliresistens TaxID=3031321 RepID=UPI0023DACCDA|nr:hypothetical protein [Salinibacterium metalliresistens]MDF1478817.1 hypothetical protein [Salinibacterium metalliresistens]
MTELETPQRAAAPSSPAAPPSVHVRALITWLAIFPLVAVGLSVMASFASEWHPVLRALVLTAVVVPTAVYIVVPRLLALYVRLRAGRS